MNYWDFEHVDFVELLGKTLISIEGAQEGSDEVRLVTSTGDTYVMYHEQDCCEGVSIEDVVGDISDLIDNPILKAEEVVSGERPADIPAPEYAAESETWTFYKLATIKGYVDIRWYGSSNGHYSEGVSLKLIPKNQRTES